MYHESNKPRLCQRPVHRPHAQARRLAVGVSPEGADPPGGMGRAPLCAGGLPVPAGGGTDRRRTADPVLRPEMTNAGTVFWRGSGVFVIQKICVLR